MGAISLYAELLLNIRQVTVFVTLPTIFNDKTQIKISPSRRLLLVTHDGDQSVLDLPIRIASSAEIKVPATQMQEFSFRLSMSREDLVAMTDGKCLDDNSRWPASALSPTSQFACRICKNIIIQDRITAWKDLPSENWAEMMDFWHCHKPYVTEDSPGTNASTKGYAASNGFVPMPGVGFVDELHLRMSSNNCVGIEVSTVSRQGPPPWWSRCAYMGNKKEACPRQCRTYDISTDTIAREKTPTIRLACSFKLSSVPWY